MATANRNRCKQSRASGPASRTTEVAHAVRSAGPSTSAAGDDEELTSEAAAQLLHVSTVTLPSLRVEPELRDAVEGVLAKGETVSSFMEDAVRAQVQRRLVRAKFVEQGLAGLAEAERTGVFYSAEQVLGELLALTQARREQLSPTRRDSQD